ncbi:MAG TPA: cupredoxin domain-containing protein [Coriobacteriia bacterium]|nr:cupredoxin domain-containing protein [Coriobacteriia bacterium]
MTPGRLIRDGIATPGPLTYFAVAAVTAVFVLAVIGYSSHIGRPAEGYLPRDIAVMPLSANSGSAVPVAASNRAAAVPAAQTVFIDASQGAFSPNQISVRAGVPVQIVFSKGSGCTTAVRFESLRIFADLDRDEVVVRLPALSRGVYPFSCAHGVATGLLLAE